ncbi:MAG: EAL domain-containing protein [Actinomycetales bacterium]|nr:EAL domain-containing protein [Actinomycetales bacterium]
MTVPYVSEGFTDLFPNAPARVDADAAPLWDCFAPEDAERGEASLRAAVRENRPWHERLRAIGESGVDRWVLTDAVPQREPDGSTIVHGLFTDVTDEVAAEEALRVSASVYASTRDGVVIMAPNGTIIDANPSFEAVVGFSSEALAGRDLRALSAGITPAVVFEDMRTSVERHGFWRGEIVTRSRLGAVATQMLTVSAVYDDAGEVSHLVGVLTSLDNIHDDLVTGLPTRQVLEDRLVQAIEAARRSGQRVALLLLGVDRFRDINETLGHRLGDLVLKEIGERLVSAVRDGGTVARVGGDEFAILVPTEASGSDIEDLVERCRGVLAAPFSPSERSVQANASIGIAVYPDDAATDAALMLAADQALRVAKGEGPASYRFFTSAMQAEARARAALSGDLRTAIADGTLEVLFQPVVSLASGELVKAEALVRWDHPTRGPISPGVFVPLAESLGLVADIGDHVFGHVLDLLEQARDLQPAFAVSLNMSPLELKAAPAVHQRRVSELRRRSIPGSLVIVEITEGVMVELNPAAAATIATYRDADVEFAIDDFGTGYSSMAYLQQLDVDFIKIDQAFVGGLAPDSGDLALCQAMVVMAHSLNLAVIAEGIETAEQAELLRSMACDFGQGYLLDRPLTAEQLLQRLREGARYL